MIFLITDLAIKNFAIIDDISISFQEGLTVLTGETGAGKSIIIDAVQLLTGSRASVDYVRHGAKKAEITGLFSLEQTDEHIYETCAHYGIDIEDDTLVLERTITNRGKSVCRINGKIVTLAILREIGKSLVNIHSQHDTVQLMDQHIHITLLDEYNTEQISPVKRKYMELYDKYTSLKQKYKTLSENEQQIAQRIDLLSFQLQELEESELQAGEDDRLHEERNQLHHFEKIYQSLHEAYFALYGEQKGLEFVDIAQNALQQVKQFDPTIEKSADELTNLYYQLEDIAYSIRNRIDEMEFDEERLNEIEARLNELNRLKKKYGSTVDEMIQYKEEIEQELEQLQNKDIHLETLRKEIEETERLAKKEAEKLTEIRKKTAKKLEKEIKTELNDLYLQHATFKVHFNKSKQLHENGNDDITFLISMNVGEPLKELSKVASGGELSRMMLAIKKIFAKHDRIGTVIFDEIDTGVSGRVAQAIAEKMYQIATTTQVLCITHLPQVAAMSDVHLLIEKETENNRTTTKIKELNHDEKVKELGRMMTGATLTETALEHSEQLLQLTRSFKAKMNV